ncbi:hypothetical protein K2173_025628 [Erythroxylum novogranatense]|uniref:Uncharacterized protein n=1 Tax=Erythroxylum novogranatense TaxID=1862640 RepID=A0AAV8SMU8_9ROSI|nr:hypothetical protein K2173_025628 [Erythroxylum novogranatense]
MYTNYPHITTEVLALPLTPRITVGRQRSRFETMDADTSDRRVLKLVYPGHFVEIHENPITAAEIMRRKPRHCVTRSDFFRYPWIVVRPESILKPGNVFYVVPYHTVHRLSQRSGFQDQLASTTLALKHEEGDSTVLYFKSSPQYFRQLLMENDSDYEKPDQTRRKIDCKFEIQERCLLLNCLPSKSYQDHHPHLGRNVPFISSGLEQKSLKYSQNTTDKPHSTFPSLKGENRYKSCRGSKQQKPISSFHKPRALVSLNGTSCPEAQFLEEQHGDQKLKPCLKQNRFAKTRKVRVRFQLPGDADK